MTDVPSAQDPPTAPSTNPGTQGPSTRKRRWVVPSIAGVVVVLIGIGAFAIFSGGSSSGTVIGVVQLISDSGHAPRLSSAQVNFSIPNTGKTSKTVNVGPSGRYMTSLPSGQWSVDVQAVYGGGNSIGNGCDITVTSGQTTRTSISLDVTNVNSSQCY
jgi:hypothetical protein